MLPKKRWSLTAAVVLGVSCGTQSVVLSVPDAGQGVGEVCGDGLDNNRDGQVDEECACKAGATQRCYPGADERTAGVGLCRDGTQVCRLEKGRPRWSPCDGVGPSVEFCGDGLDNDCDGQVDEQQTVALFADADGDGHGDPAKQANPCLDPGPGYVANATDCDDGNKDIHPSAVEVCDGVDNDCNQNVDEGQGVTATTCGQGDCQGQGQRSCVGGRWVDTCQAKADGTSCSDQDLCTSQDRCQAGVCAGTPSVTCPQPGPCQVVGTCQSATGQCSAPTNKADGTACDDQNLCTRSDSCQAGACAGQNPVVCSAPSACHVPGQCDPSTGQCGAASPKPNGASCDDQNLCTQVDVCQGGTCVGTSPRSCASPNACQDPGTCQPATGQCTYPSKPDGTACSDGNLCTQTDACRSGQCVGQNPIACTTANPCHNPGTCQPSTGQCSASSPKPNGSACNDGNACTRTDTCQSGSCTGQNPVVCPANGCQNPGVCQSATGQCTAATPKADGTACNDGNLCTQADSCQSGNCVGQNPRVCTAQSQCHLVGTCDPSSGQCSNPTKPAGSVCNDQVACTTNDVCQAGVCAGTPPPGVVSTFPSSGWSQRSRPCSTGMGICGETLPPNWVSHVSVDRGTYGVPENFLSPGGGSMAIKFARDTYNSANGWEAIAKRVYTQVTSAASGNHTFVGYAFQHQTNQALPEMRLSVYSSSDQLLGSALFSSVRNQWQTQSVTVNLTAGSTVRVALDITLPAGTAGGADVYFALPGQGTGGVACP